MMLLHQTSTESIATHATRPVAGERGSDAKDRLITHSYVIRVVVGEAECAWDGFFGKCTPGYGGDSLVALPFARKRRNLA